MDSAFQKVLAKCIPELCKCAKPIPLQRIGSAVICCAHCGKQIVALS